METYGFLDIRDIMSVIRCIGKWPVFSFAYEAILLQCFIHCSDGPRVIHYRKVNLNNRTENYGEHGERFPENLSRNTFLF